MTEPSPQASPAAPEPTPPAPADPGGPPSPAPAGDSADAAPAGRVPDPAPTPEGPDASAPGSATAAPAGAAPGDGTGEAAGAPGPGAAESAAGPPGLPSSGTAPGAEGASALPGDGAGADATLSLLASAAEFLDKGGVAMWLIAALSVATLGLILLKLWRLIGAGAWRRARAEAAVELWTRGERARAAEAALEGRGLRARIVAAAIRATEDHGGPTPEAREETTRVARRLLAETGSGLRALELIATIAPLLGLFGTVLGMIGAFQALQSAGVRADPATLAGGIWEALLTTAAGMAVAIPASAALTWFESVSDRVRLDMEDLATRVFTRSERPALARAAE